MKLFSIIAVLCVSVFFSGCFDKAVPVIQDVSAEYINYCIESQISVVPRNAGTEGLKKTADFIYNETKKYAESKKISFTDSTPAGPLLFTNIEAVVKGKSDKYIIIAAHYDAKKIDGGFQAANDGASGVAALLVMLKNFKENNFIPEYTLKFVFFDGEECILNYSENDGFHGSRHYVKNMINKDMCKAMILLDMIGDKDLQIQLSADTNPFLCKLAFQAAKNLGKEELVTMGNTVIHDDHTAFANIGIPAVDLIDFQYGPNNVYWHTFADSRENISAESIISAANLANEIIRLIR